MEYFAGLDVSMKGTYVCVVDREGDVVVGPLGQRRQCREEGNLYHDRMPLVPELEDVDAWLCATPGEAAALLRPAKDVLQERPLGKAINNLKNTGPELLV